ncbi:MAG: cobalt ECF transporter T component CbiQ [Chroococcidiopsidaceae cyanobacterium CP_BM_RX_35]|nr:cobalt ECF transporter T component CbiQ [Chroococcidiopsidaceae cyanobacterium CP_BM_RX_35]
MTLQIDTLAYTNRLRQLPPEHKLLLAIALLILTYAAQIPVQLLIALWIGIWTVIYARIPAPIYFKLMAVPAGFWLSSLPALAINGVAITNWATVQTDIWQGFTWGSYYLYLSRYGMQQAGELLARALAATSCIYFVMLTVPFVELLQILRRLHCPPLLTDLLLLMYRFIFTLLRTSNEVWTAQHSRNGYCTWKISMNSLGILVGQLLQRTLINYRQVSLSLASRGFTGEFRVWHSRQYSPSWRYSLEAILGCAILAGLSYAT